MFPLFVALLVLCLLEGMVSMYLNLGIVFIYMRSRMRGLKLNPSSLIHLIMGTNNVIMRFSRIVDDLCLWVPAIYHSGFFYITVALLEFNLYFNYWLTAWLCAYYCLIITNFRYPLVVSMKKNLAAFMPYLLFLTAVGSVAIALLYFVYTEMDILVPQPVNGTQFAGFTTENNNMTSLYTVLATTLGTGLPFIGIAFFLLVTVLVLRKHVQSIGHTGSNVQVHISAIKTMVMFVIVSALFFICDLIIVIRQYDDKDPITVISWNVISLFPTAEAIIIIYASPKLKMIFPRWLRIGALREE